MFEATHSERCTAPARAVWELWADVSQWPRWHERVERASVSRDDADEDDDAGLAVGATVKLKYRRGGTSRFVIARLEPEHLLLTEQRLPGARFGYEHRLDPGRHSVEVTHRVFLDGRLAGFWAAMMGRKRLVESIERFAAREKEITEPGAVS